MSYTRQRFFKRVRDDLLSGAFQEYMCREISLKVGLPDFWSNEVSRLLAQVPQFLDRKAIATEFKDREKALTEAFSEMYHSYDIINAAKNKVLGYPGNGKYLRKVMALDLDTKEEFRNMIHEFLPQFNKLLP